MEDQSIIDFLQKCRLDHHRKFFESYGIDLVEDLKNIEESPEDRQKFQQELSSILLPAELIRFNKNKNMILKG